MKNKKLQPVILLLLFCVSSITTKAQLLNKLKKKVESSASKPSEKTTENTEQADNKKTKDPAPVNGGAVTTSEKPTAEAGNSGESDFIPGSTVLYFDNFEKERNGDSPSGWLTTSSAEVVAVDGQNGKWLKLASVSSSHITRNKKQSWSNSFTVEFDLIIIKKTYDPRIDFALINTGGSLVTDEMILRNGKNIAYVSTILGNEGKTTRVSLYGNNNINKPIEDRMSEQLAYSSIVPIHVSMCAQGKRFRFWWNDKKVFDAAIIDEQYIPNQLGINFGSVGGSEYYITNIRVAKDIPATKPANPVADKSTVDPVSTDNSNNKPAASSDAPAAVNLQSKLLTVNLPYAQIMKTGEFSYTFIATKEEGNNKENYFKLNLVTGNTSLKAETFNFKEINQKNPLYGTKKYPEIVSTEAVLYYGTTKKPYIYKFSPIVANGTMASYVDASLLRKLPPPSATTKFVIEKVEDGKASGYFLLGIMIQGLKPVTKGDAMTETFTDGFSGEMKCKFTNVPVY